MRKTYHYRAWVIEWAEVQWAATRDGSRWRFGGTLEKVKQNIDEQEFLWQMERQLSQREPNARSRMVHAQLGRDQTTGAWTTAPARDGPGRPQNRIRTPWAYDSHQNVPDLGRGRVRLRQCPEVG